MNTPLAPLSQMGGVCSLVASTQNNEAWISGSFSQGINLPHLSMGVWLWCAFSRCDNMSNNACSKQFMQPLPALVFRGSKLDASCCQTTHVKSCKFTQPVPALVFCGSKLDATCCQTTHVKLRKFMQPSTSLGVSWIQTN